MTYVVIDSTIAITCEADGYPAPRYYLLHNGTTVLSNVTEAMLIFRVKYMDAEIFECRAVNELGQSSKGIKVNVLDEG